MNNVSIDIKELRKMSSDLKLLYVEDDLLARKGMLNLLNRFFKDITVAVNGEDGLEKFKSKTHDLIISDINMPKMSGLDMIKIIREDNLSIPVLLLSAHDESSFFLNAIKLDVDGYILKPIQSKQLLNEVSKIVRKINLLALESNYKNTLEAEVKSKNSEILYKLNHDPLTKLLSRHAFFRNIEGLSSSVILLIDIDKFNVINEVYGTDIGSKVLQKFANYLQHHTDETCLVHRLSADEFALVDTAKYIDTDKYELLIERLFKNLDNLKIQVDEHAITIDITIGLSAGKGSYENAKIALDYAKKYKKNFIMYSTEIDHRNESKITLACRDDISSAINENRVVAVYQPIVNKLGKTIKYETLMRLQEENTFKLISPFYFLEVAIKTRFYQHLSSTIIFLALNKLKDSKHTLSINFTYSDIKNTDLIKRIDSFFKEHRDIGCRTVFEITESQAIENYDDVKHFIQHFRKYGVKIAIDDFGSGFSNFEYILAIDPDYLKIDGTLVKNIDTDSRAFTLVEAIVEFSHKLGIKVIAEYVHSEVIFNMLKKLDVDEYQGFYFSQPLDKI